MSVLVIEYPRLEEIVLVINLNVFCSLVRKNEMSKLVDVTDHSNAAS